MIGIPLGLLVSNAVEWGFHKWVLHGLGKNKRSFWAFHFHEHHQAARRNGMRDPGYEGSVWRWSAQGKEALALTLGVVAVAPLAPVAPFFVGTVTYCALDYYRKHKRSHLDPEWARKNLPWHYAHHMGRVGEANWCVTRPWFDRLLGTVAPMPGIYPPDSARAPAPAPRDGARAAAPG